MRLIDADYVTEKLNEINGTAELDKAFEVVENAPTVCDIEQIRDEIKDARLNQINDETEKAVNYGLNTALEIIEKYTK